MKTLVATLVLCGFIHIALAQDSDKKPQRMNTIKVEFTQPLYPNSFVLSYERVTKPNQTFCITGGYEEFPNLLNLGSNISVEKNINQGGFKTGAEYRFYLEKENKYLAPHGVYIGPYVSYHDFNNERKIAYDDNGVSDYANLNTDFRILNFGFELGYQFVINNRWTIDFVLVGPSISRYNARLKLEGEFTFDKEEVENEIILKLLERFPLLEDVLNQKEISSKGTLDSWAYGWRYQFHIGYHFGRKKN